MGTDIFHYVCLLRSPSNLTWDTSTDGASRTFSRWSVPVPYQSQSKDFPLYLQHISTHFQFKTTTSCPTATGSHKNIFLISSPMYSKYAMRFPQSLASPGSTAPAPSAFLHRRGAAVLWSFLLLSSRPSLLLNCIAVNQFKVIWKFLNSAYFIGFLFIWHVS